ncbi:MAG: DUF104 domain-containing protein [Gemmataceae bacterium]|nr:DUF104 domain-containing protein [Gemmataceae bacterium]
MSLRMWISRQKNEHGNLYSWRCDMNQIEAIFQHGVFEPLEPVDLKEEQRIRLSVEPAEKEAMEAWLKRVDERREAIFKREGLLPDSTLDIAEDRRR